MISYGVEDIQAFFPDDVELYGDFEWKNDSYILIFENGKEIHTADMTTFVNGLRKEENEKMVDYSDDVDVRKMIPLLCESICRHYDIKAGDRVFFRELPCLNRRDDNNTIYSMARVFVEKAAA